jgi:SAM-dependent methyltransferase
MVNTKTQVQEFYNQVGWQEVGDGVYQNATYEDLRPVSRQYIHDCHLRVLRHLKPQGRLLLDAGSGPIQYPEYLEYSKNYQHRVCLDISSVALQEARKRIGDAAAGGHGLFVAADIANLPFKPGVFDSAVSLHAIHHLPFDEHLRAYQELYRVLAPTSTAVIVNGWDLPPLTVFLNFWIQLAEKLRRISPPSPPGRGARGEGSPRGTYVRKHTPAWLKREVGAAMPVEIWCWRSVSVRFLRTFIHPRLGGRLKLRLLYWLEERLPHWFGENGQYPLIVIRKPKD